MELYSYIDVLFEDLFHTVIQEREFPNSAQMKKIIKELIEKNKHLEPEDAQLFKDRVNWVLIDKGIDDIKEKILVQLLRDGADESTKNYYTNLANKINYTDGIPKELINEVSLCPGLISLLHEPHYFLLALQSNHIAVLNTGITKGIQNTHPSLYKLLKKIWRKASQFIHPFQKGATHQGTHHCHIVNKNLNKIGSYSGLNFNNLHNMGDHLVVEEAFILKLAAAVHDLGKAHIEETKYHELAGYNFIMSHPLNLSILPGLKKGVANIVKYHDGIDPLDSIGSLLGDPFYDTFVIDGKKKRLELRLKQVAAIFRLADVMDMTNERVSEIVLRISQTFPPTLTPENYRKIINRKCVKFINFNQILNRIDITTFPNLSSSDIQSLDEGILFENKKLDSTTTGKLLDLINVPNKFYRV